MAEKHIIPWLWPPQRQCTAKSKRSGRQCRRWASPGKSVCFFHGGRSTGPKTTAGIEAIRKAHYKHGRYNTILAKRKFFVRSLKFYKPAFREGTKYYKEEVLSRWQDIKQLPWSEFCRKRHLIYEYLRSKRKRNR